MHILTFFNRLNGLNGIAYLSDTSKETKQNPTKQNENKMAPGPCVDESY